uniref:dTMP kinase n=1 Tax=Camelus bactrianus TaxID=9837 RepID=A0A9W3FVG3_CAMBA|nr:thymidylate kinase isoform X1 [Camelus bactrianus]
MCFFPFVLERSTEIGKLLSSYLEKKSEVEDHSVHLLFSANRWEQVPLIKEKLGQGITLVVDRYAFSGVAFTSAKENFSLDWCKQPDVGLPKPDLVVFLQLRLAEAAARSEFGQERYEDRAFQEQVLRRFHQLQGDTSLNWKSLATSLYLRPMLPQPGPRDPSQRLRVLRETPSLRAPPDPSMMVDASRSIEEVHQEICTLSKDTIQAAAQRPLGELWK